MVQIRVKCGGCGIKYTDANGTARHALKTPEHGPFECDDAQAARLVSLGVAEYVGTSIPQSAAQQEEPVVPSQEPEKVMGHLSAEDLETWNFNDLKKLAADMGVTPNGKKKADYIAAIVAEEVELDPQVDPDDEDDLPKLTAADPE